MRSLSDECFLLEMGGKALKNSLKDPVQMKNIQLQEVRSAHEYHLIARKAIQTRVVEYLD
jgi:hypothetical protein